MRFSEPQSKLFTLAEEFITDFVRKRGRFDTFAVVTYTDGRTGVVQPSEETGDLSSILYLALSALHPLAKSGEITGSAICTSIADGNKWTAVIDLEVKEEGRLLAFLPYKKRLLGGWHFGEKEYKRDAPKIFAA